jgi:hypothetical protein
MNADYGRSYHKKFCLVCGEEHERQANKPLPPKCCSRHCENSTLPG